jgi:hypothetical protein
MENEATETKFVIRLADGLYYAGKVPGTTRLRKDHNPVRAYTFISRFEALKATEENSEFNRAAIMTFDEALES